MTVDANKLRCTFVTNLAKCIERMRYSVAEQSLDEHYKDFANMRAFEEDCIDVEAICDADENYPNTYIDCTNTTTVSPCSTDVNLVLSAVNELCTYTMRAYNSRTGSAYPIVTTAVNSTDITGKIKVDTLNSCTNLAVNPVEYTTTSKAYTTFTFATSSFAGSGYVKEIDFYITDTSGVLVPTPVTVDVSPLSPYIGVVNPANLLFSNTGATIATALQTVITNALTALYGAGSFGVVVEGTGASIRIKMLCKHVPAGRWVGLKNTTSKSDIRIFTGTGLSTFTTNGSVIEHTNATIYYTYTPCSPNNVHSYVSFTSRIGYGNQDFNLISINGNTGLDPITLLTPNVLSTNCNRYVVTTAAGTTPYVTIEWRNDASVIVSTDPIFITTTPGTYSCKIYAADGCSELKYITLA